MSRLPCFVRLPILIATLFFLTFNHSMAFAADKSWQTGEGSDPANDGRPVAWLDFGVPETDDIQVRIACKAQEAGAPELDAVFGAALGDLKNGADATLTFSGGGFDHEVPGVAHGVGAEVGITGVKLDTGIDDPLWDALTQKDSLEYKVAGQDKASLNLKPGHRRIGNFVEACRSFVKEEAVKTAEAKSPDQGQSAPESAISEREAYDAAKDLGTIEAWEAFLENFSDGFRADLARAYLKRLGSGDSTASGGAEKTETAAAPPPPAPADISLAMTSDGACTGGRNCSVTVTATNTGGEPFSGDLTIATSVSPGGAELQGTGTPPFSCEGAGGGAICSTGLANIAPGQSATVPMTFTLPRNAGGQVTTCASIAWGGVPANLGAREVQRKLNELGFDAGPVDGQPGRQTVGAIKAFQQSAGIQETGEIDLPLLLALFAPGGPGDANPVNDQACAGAAVTSAPPLPAAYQGPAQPEWTPPSGYGTINRNAKPKKCSSRSVWLEGQCILKSQVRSFCGPGFSRKGSRCVSNAPAPVPTGSAVTGCGGNSIRIGNVCVNIANAPVFGGRPGSGGGQTFTGSGKPNNQQGGGQTATPQGGKCPAGLVWAPGWDKCVTKAMKVGLDGEIAAMRRHCLRFSQQYNCVSVTANKSCPPGLKLQNQFYCVCPDGQTNRGGKCVAGGGKQNQQQAAPPPVIKQVRPQQQPSPPQTTVNCINGAFKSWATQCRCRPGFDNLVVLSRTESVVTYGCQQKTAAPPPKVKQVRPQQPPKKTVNCINGAFKAGPGCACKSGFDIKAYGQTGNTLTYGCVPKAGTAQQAAPPPAPGIKCGPGMQPQGNTCVSINKPGATTTKQIICPSNLVPQNGKCGCAPGLTWNGKVCAVPQQAKQQPVQQPQQQQQKKQQAAPAPKGCKGGQVRQANGNCACPNGLAYIKKQCVNVGQLFGGNQNQQPQQQQQQQPQNQQQQQLQQGIQQLQKILSDRRLKRDIELIATRADGLKLYSFRYLWDNTAYVGVMAQDLAEDPARADAVSLHESGFYHVDYGMLGLEMVTLEAWRAANP